MTGWLAESRASTKASTTSGSNCVPLQCFSSLTASSRLIPEIALPGVLVAPATYTLAVSGGLAFFLYSVALHRYLRDCVFPFSRHYGAICRERGLSAADFRTVADLRLAFHDDIHELAAIPLSENQLALGQRGVLVVHECGHDEAEHGGSHSGDDHRGRRCRMHRDRSRQEA